jgi:signal transduction histidine kinase
MQPLWPAGLAARTVDHVTSGEQCAPASGARISLRAGLIGLLLAVAALPVVLALAFGSGYLRLPGGWPVLAGATAVQVAASFAVVRVYRRPALAAGLVSGLAVVFVVVADAWPGTMYAVGNASTPWLPVAGSMAGGWVVYDIASQRESRLASVFLAIASLVALRPWHGSWTLVAQGLALFGAPVLVGLAIASRRQVIIQLRARVDDARREQRLLADRARAEERARLAEEMHDVVTHRLSLMVLQAGALRMTAADPVTRVAAEELRVAGVQALDELRDLVGVLRGPAGLDLAASPAALDLTELVDRSVTAGLAVRLQCAGSPLAVAPVVARTVYRIVQEALTNVSKPAPSAETTVLVHYGLDGVRVNVANTAPVLVAALGHDPELVATGSGQGLAGLARRIELMSGRFRAEPDDTGRFVVDAYLPAYVPTAA